MYNRLDVTSGTIFLTKYAFLPFKNFSLYFSSLCFYFSDKTVYNIGDFLKINAKNIWAAITRLKIPIMNIINSSSDAGEISKVS